MEVTDMEVLDLQDVVDVTKKSIKNVDQFNQFNCINNFNYYFIYHIHWLLSKEIKTNYLYSLQTDMWYHAVMTYNGSNIILYIDGKEVFRTLQATGPILKDDDPLLIGGLHASTGDSAFHEFDGIIDDVIIFNRSLSSDEISALYANTSTTYLNNLSPASSIDSFPSLIALTSTSILSFILS